MGGWTMTDYPPEIRARMAERGITGATRIGSVETTEVVDGYCFESDPAMTFSVERRTVRTEERPLTAEEMAERLDRG